MGNDTRWIMDIGEDKKCSVCGNKADKEWRSEGSWKGSAFFCDKCFDALSEIAKENYANVMKGWERYEF